ncbi:hypothetical protein BDR05DRAFT_963820 [Suillus weaverae]|nr:hypothetical protein BDR05DRAFT_963820 [Suillus weaverae]
MELIDRIIDDASYWPHSTIYIERPITVPAYRDGKRTEDGIYIRSLPLGIHGTEGDFRLVEQDFEDGGAAWEKKWRIGGLDDALPSAPMLSSHPCRKIEFQLWTHDQRLRKQFPHTFTASYVWCDVSIEKLQAPISDITEWPARYLFEECNAELSSIIPRDTDGPFFPLNTKSSKNVAAKTSGSDHTMFWHSSDAFDKDADGDCFWQFLDNTFDKQAAKTAAVGKLVRSLQVGDCMTLLAHGRYPNSESKVHEARMSVYWAV